MLTRKTNRRKILFLVKKYFNNFLDSDIVSLPSKLPTLK